MRSDEVGFERGMWLPHCNEVNEVDNEVNEVDNEVNEVDKEVGRATPTNEVQTRSK